MESLDNFAKRERLKIRLDECGDPIIKGRFGHFDDNRDGRIGVVLIRKTGHWKQKLKQLCGKVDPICHVEGDTEAVFLATIEQREFLTLAIRALGVKRKRRVSEQTAERLRAMAYKRSEPSVDAQI